jgi:hypothetical protein
MESSWSTPGFITTPRYLDLFLSSSLLCVSQDKPIGGRGRANLVPAESALGDQVTPLPVCLLSHQHHHSQVLTCPLIESRSAGLTMTGEAHVLANDKLCFLKFAGTISCQTRARTL